MISLARPRRKTDEPTAEGDADGDADGDTGADGDADASTDADTSGTTANADTSGTTANADTSGTTANADDPDVALRADGLRKSYGSMLPFGRTVEVLTGADLEIPSAEIVGIVGANGSGKSTLMKILVGVLERDGGTVERNGAVGWCPQETLLYDKLTVRETFDLFGEGYGMTDDEISQAREWLADELDFEKFLDYRVENLSGGNQQKVNLSVAVMHDPDVLLLDEPYTGFDWDTYLSFWDLTESLVERGTSVAIISHLVEEKKRFDRIYHLEEGKLRREE